jgi:hypothetical protein
MRSGEAMKKGFFSSVLVSLAGASLALAQSPYHLPDRSPGAPESKPAGSQTTVPAPASENPAIPSSSSVFDGLCMSGYGDSCCAPANVCGPFGRFWVSAEYLLWWTKGSNLPPLVTTGPATSATPGALGALGTGVIFAGRSVNDQPLSGGRFTAGFWLNNAQTTGIEGSYFFLGSGSNTMTASSTGAPGSAVLARPFFDVSTGLQNSELIAFPGLAAGTVSVRSTSQLQGAQANLLSNLCCSCFDWCNPCQPARGYRVDLLGGFVYLNLGDGLGVNENIQVLPGSPILPGETIRAFDQVNTRNQFYGGQIGARAEVWQGRWFANVRGMVALGTTNQTVDINGLTTVTPPIAGLGGPGDLLTLPSNIGHYSRNVFSVVPQVGFNAGYQVTPNVRVFAGYTFLYWSNVVRPSDVLDLRVNSTRTPVSLVPPSGPAAPVFNFRDGDFWAQGINVGFQVRY